MGKRRTEARQDVLLLMESGDIAGLTLDTIPGYVISDETIEAWELDFNQQAKDEETNKFVQVISERTKKPLKIFSSRESLKGESTNSLADRKRKEEIARRSSYNNKNSMMLWLGILAVLFAVVISAVVLMNMKGHEAASAFVVPLIASRVFRRKLESIESDSEIGGLNIIKTGEVFCLISVDKSAQLLRRMLNNELIPDNSIERKYEGKPCHLLNLNKDNKLLAIEPPDKIDPEQSPTKCYMAAMMYGKIIPRILKLRDLLVEKIKIGFFVAFCIAELIILFLIASEAMGA